MLYLVHFSGLCSALNRPLSGATPLFLGLALRFNVIAFSKQANTEQHLYPVFESCVDAFFHDVYKFSLYYI